MVFTICENGLFYTYEKLIINQNSSIIMTNLNYKLL